MRVTEASRRAGGAGPEILLAIRRGTDLDARGYAWVDLAEVARLAIAR